MFDMSVGPIKLLVTTQFENIENDYQAKLVGNNEASPFRSGQTL